MTLLRGVVALLLVVLAGCVPSEPDPGFELTEHYVALGVEVPAEPCDVVVASANEAEPDSYERKLSADVALRMSAAMSAYRSDELARAARKGEYSADDPWGFDEQDRAFMESGALEEACATSYEPQTLVALEGLFRRNRGFDAVTYRMYKRYLLS